jgi:hypothetical protein
MDSSTLRRLPAELRIKIYEYALTFDRVSCRPHGSSRFWPERSLASQLALTRVCRQIRAECKHLPFTLNKLVVGTAPWQERPFSISQLYSLADEVAQNIASIPSGLIFDSTKLSLELCPKAKSMLQYGITGPLITRQLITDWIAIRLFFGKLLRKAQTHNIVLDVTPGDEKYGLHLWCEAGDHDPSETGLESRYEVRATVACHRDHDRSVCNVAKHGEELLAQVGHLDYHAGAIITQNMHVWNSNSSLQI